MMGVEQKSLRSLIDKWLAPTSARPARLTGFGRTAQGGRFVCLEALRSAEPLAIFFFYHGDGAWAVFPPERNSLVMAAAGQPKHSGRNGRPSYASIGDVCDGQLPA